ncbi:MAG: ATP-binding protein [Clostridium sp.]|nr:ATP-binding protein [Clostridium sp.]
MSVITIAAKTENLDRVLAFVEEELEQLAGGRKAAVQIAVAVEEIFVNIAQYAYGPLGGDVTIEIFSKKEPEEVTIFFKDSGIPYDPLARPDPDVTLSIEERPIGGLGVYMVKKSMDEVFYEYKDGQNILRLRKTL